MKAIIAEDHKSLRESMVNLMVQKGLEVTEVDDGVPLVEELRRERYDFVVTDFNMPKMNGIEATKAIRAFNPVIPIYLFSVDLTDAYREYARKAGVTRSWPKVDFKGALEIILEDSRKK